MRTIVHHFFVTRARQGQCQRSARVELEQRGRGTHPRELVKTIHHEGVRIVMGDAMVDEF